MNRKVVFDILFIGDDYFLINEIGYKIDPMNISIVRVSTFEEFLMIYKSYQFKVILVGFYLKNYKKYSTLVTKIRKLMSNNKNKTKLYTISLIPESDEIVDNFDFNIGLSYGIFDYLKIVKSNLEPELSSINTNS